MLMRLVFNVYVHEVGVQCLCSWGWCSALMFMRLVFSAYVHEVGVQRLC